VRVRHCPACRTDYRPEIVSCADCGQLLVDWDDELDLDDGAAVPPEEGLSGVPKDFLPIFTAAGVRDLTPLADRLVAEGIDFRLRDARKGCCVIAYRLLVHPRDHERARAAVGELAGRVTAVGAPGASDGDAAGAIAGYECCPACEAALPSGASECPECGLPLAEPEATCRACGHALGDDPMARCGSCGASPLGDE
jgi:hypothetical protein